MKDSKFIRTKLNNQYDATFTLQYVKNNEGNDAAILTAPYVKWENPETPVILNRVFSIEGKVLECIEKNYFDKNITAIPIEGYPNGVEMPDIIFEVLSPKLLKQMLSNTFTIDKNADDDIKILFLHNTNKKDDADAYP